jgi:hypothetical protein
MDYVLWHLTRVKMERVKMLIELLRGRARRLQVKDADQMADSYPPLYLNHPVLSSFIDPALREFFMDLDSQWQSHLSPDL